MYIIFKEIKYIYFLYNEGSIDLWMFYFGGEVVNEYKLIKVVFILVNFYCDKLN